MTYKVLVIAHRGACAIEPENTLRAFDAAYRMGADGLELDIFLTKDEKIVVTHNNDTRQITGEKMTVRKSLFRELRRLDFGHGERIPTLEEVFDHFLNKFSHFNVEIKPTGLRTDGIEAKLAQCIKKFSCEKKILVSSFNPLNIKRFRLINPNVRIGYLMCREQNGLLKNTAVIRWLNPDTLNLDQNLFADRGSRPLFETSKNQWLWTVNTVDQMKFWVTQPRVEAIITNHPEKLIQVMAGHYGKL